MMLPRALAPFLAFPQALREAGFAASPEQTEGFIAAVGLLGPRALGDVRRAAHALFGPEPERRAGFDEVFDRVFLGRFIAAPVSGEAEDLPPAFDAAGFELLSDGEEIEETGAQATRAERRSRREFSEGRTDDAVRRLRRTAARALPRRKARRLERVAAASPIRAAPSG